MKPRRPHCALVAALLLAPPPAAAELPASTRALQAEALASDRAFELVASLVTEVGPRFAGTPGDAASIAWSVERLRAAGFSEVRLEPVEVPRWERGDAAAEIVAPWPQRLAVLALGGSVGTPAEGIEAEVVAVEDLDALAALAAREPDAVRGRIVFFTRRMERSVDGAGYGATVPIRGRGAAEAGKLGAVAVVIRSVGTDDDRRPHTGATRYEPGGPRIPAAALGAADAALLARQLASGRPVRLRLRLGCRDAGVADSANVVAELAGRERPEEIVLVVAHRDSWDVGFGAQDNGTGVAVAIEAARLAAAAGLPRRTLRVLLTANEEFGLSGARAYAAAHAAEMPRHVLALEADSGGGRVVGLATRLAAADAAAGDELAALLAPLAVGRLATPARGGADLSRLRPLGVPMIDLDQDRSLYFDVHHTDADTLEQIDREALRQVTAAYATALEWAANRTVRLASLPPEPEAP